MRQEDMRKVVQALVTEADVIRRKEERDRVELKGVGTWNADEGAWHLDDARAPSWQGGPGPVPVLASFTDADGEETVQDMTLIPHLDGSISLRPMDTTDTASEPGPISNIRVQPNTAWLTKGIRRAYNCDPTSEPGDYHRRIISITEPSYERHDFKPIESDELNPSQCRAVGQATSTPETFIWGPPGTGKTHTLGHTIAELVRQGKRVLVTAATHKAVEQLMNAARKHDIVRTLEAEKKVYWAKRTSDQWSTKNDTQSMSTNTPQLIFCTAHAAILSPKVRKAVAAAPLDAAIVDEASMTITPLTAAVAAMGKHHRIIAGDFRQIGPIVQSKPKYCAHVHHWLGLDIFRQAGIAARVSDGAGKDDPRLVQLDVQYRASKPLSEFVNAIAYPDAPMKTPPNVGDEPADAGPLGAYPLIYIDTGTLGPWASRPEDGHGNLGGTTANVMHAAIIRRILKALSNVEDPREIGVIAPYNAQRLAIQRQIMQGDPTLEQIYHSVATAHAFQGGERRTIVFDRTDGQFKPVEFGDKPRRSGRHKPPRRLVNTEGTFFEGRDINDPKCGVPTVALSRAKSRLVFVLDGQETWDCSQPGSQTERVLMALKKHGQAVDVQKLFAEDMRQAISHGPDPAPQDLIVKQLREAKSSIVWNSPWTHGTKADPKILEELKAAANRGVDVRVDITENRDDEGPTLSGHLSDTGLKVGRTSPLGVEAIIIDKEWTVRPGWPALESFDADGKPRHVVALRDRELAHQAQLVLKGRKLPWQRGPAKRPEPEPKIDQTRRRNEKEKEQEAKKEDGRTLGCCPKPNCGKTLKVCKGRYGEFVGCSGYDYDAPKDKRCTYTRELTAIERTVRNLPPADHRREERWKKARDSHGSRKEATSHAA